LKAAPRFKVFLFPAVRRLGEAGFLTVAGLAGQGKPGSSLPAEAAGRVEQFAADVDRGQVEEMAR
jgi:hypothetical protein